MWAELLFYLLWIYLAAVFLKNQLWSLHKSVRPFWHLNCVTCSRSCGPSRSVMTIVVAATAVAGEIHVRTVSKIKPTFCHFRPWNTKSASGMTMTPPLFLMTMPSYANTYSIFCMVHNQKAAIEKVGQPATSKLIYLLSCYKIFLYMEYMYLYWTDGLWTTGW